METPDPWQRSLLRDAVTLRRDCIVLASRQSGKTTTISLVSYLRGAEGGFVLIVAPGDRQAMEFLDRIKSHHKRLNLAQLTVDTMHELRFSNGGRILAVPNNEKTIRIYSAVSLLVLEEASRVPDRLYGTVRPMLAVSKGQTILISTPFGQRGFFWQEWQRDKSKWAKHRVPWSMCPRITPEFIEEERAQHGEHWVAQEYELCFNPVTGAFFNIEDFQACVDLDLTEVRPW